MGYLPISPGKRRISSTNRTTLLTEPEKSIKIHPWPGTGGNWDDMTNAAGDGSWDAPAGDDWSAPAAQPILGMAGKMAGPVGSLRASLPLTKWWERKTIRSYWDGNFSGANC